MQAVDSVAALMRADASRRAIVRHTDPSFRRESASWRLAELVADRLVLVGVDPERVAPTRVAAVRTGGLPARRDAVEILLGRAPDR